MFISVVFFVLLGAHISFIEKHIFNAISYSLLVSLNELSNKLKLESEICFIMLIGRVEEVGMYSEFCKHTLKVLPPKTSNSLYPYRVGYLSKYLSNTHKPTFRILKF